MLCFLTWLTLDLKSLGIKFDNEPYNCDQISYKESAVRKLMLTLEAFLLFAVWLGYRSLSLW